MKVETYRCDNCDKARDQDTNHWSQVMGLSDGHSRGVISLPPNKMYRLGDNSKLFDFVAPLQPVDACGDECRFALMQRFLATGSFKRSPVGEVERAS